MWSEDGKGGTAWRREYCFRQLRGEREEQVMQTVLLMTRSGTRLARYGGFFAVALLLAATVAMSASQPSVAGTTLVSFPGSVVEGTPVVPIGDDRFLVIENEAAYIWDGRARRGYAVRNTGRWESPKAVAVGGKVLIVGYAVAKDASPSKQVSARKRELDKRPSRDLLLYDPRTETGVPGQLRVGAYLPGIAGISNNEVWVVGGWVPKAPYDNVPSRNVERVIWDGSGALRIDKVPDLNIPRAQSAVAVLRDGRVMAIGGRTDKSEIFDPRTRRWDSGSMMGIYSFNEYPLHVVLPDGRVVVTAHQATGSNLEGTERQPWVWSPAWGWRSFPLTTRLGFSPPVVVGDDTLAVLVGNAMQVINLRELRDNPTMRMFDLQKYRHYAALVRLTNGEIHAIGGIDRDGRPQQSVEIIGAIPGKPAETGPLQLPLAFTVPARLSDGRVLLAGNWGIYGNNPRQTTIVDPTVRVETQVKRHYDYARGINPEKVQIEQGYSVVLDQTIKRIPPKEKVLQPIGLVPRAFSMPDGSVVVVGSLRPPEKAGGKPVIPAQRWDPRTGKWAIVPNLNVTIGSPNDDSGPRPEDIAQRTNGDLVLFDSPKMSGLSGNTRVQVWRHASGVSQDLGLMIKWRTGFSALELADGRIAVVGGSTQDELIAREKDCTRCPDEYVSYGDVKEAGSTEVYDFAARKWVPGPYSRYPGGIAVRLKDGRVVKVGSAMQGERMQLVLEISDVAFNRWKTASLPPSNVNFSFKRVVALGNRVLLLGYVLGRDEPGLVWNADNDQWSVLRVNSRTPTDQVLVLDEKRIFLVGGGYTRDAAYGSAEVP